MSTSPAASAAALRLAGRLLLFGLHLLQVSDQQSHADPLERYLHRLVVLNAEGGAQHFVPAYDLIESLLQGRDVESATDTQHHGRHIVGSRIAAFQLVQEPQPLLGKGQGQALFAR